jgi:Helitron helicase-like domain at N-terminus
VTMLSSSFTEESRHMRGLYHDFMTIIHSTLKSDLFVTVIVNSQWPEIISQLESNQTAQDHSDIIFRVFKTKLKTLIHDFTKCNVFGKVIAHMHVVEFQK